MLKDTKSLGNNKAPACESRGFVLKKEGVLFDTPSISQKLRLHNLFVLIILPLSFLLDEYHILNLVQELLQSLYDLDNNQ